MDPASLAIAAAAMVAKTALEKVGDHAGESGWGAVAAVTHKVRSWFSDAGDDEGTKAVEVVEAAPDSERASARLAELLEAAIGRDTDLAAELARLVAEAEGSTDQRVSNFAVQVRDQARVGRIIQVTGDYHEGA